MFHSGIHTSSQYLSLKNLLHLSLNLLDNPQLFWSKPFPSPGLPLQHRLVSSVSPELSTDKSLSFRWAVPAFAACSCWDSSSLLSGFIHLAWLEALWGRDSIRIISQPSWFPLPAPSLHSASAPQQLRSWRMSLQHCPLIQAPWPLILQSPRSPTKR